MRAVVFCLFSLFGGICYGDFPAVPGISPLKAESFKESLEARNIPPGLSQDTLGICFAYPASTLLTSENCRALKKDCSNLKDTEIFSPLGLANYGKIDDTSDDGQVPVPGFEKGGHPLNAMSVVNYLTDSAPSEACTSLDKVLDKIGGAQAGTEAQLAVWENLKKKYTEFKAKEKKCPTCATDFSATAQGEINENFSLKKSNEEILRAFSKETYNEFMASLLTPAKCNRPSQRVYLKASDKLEVKSLPSDDKKKSNYKEAISTIKKVLADGRGLAISSLCLQDKVPKRFEDCEAAHAMTIIGYRQVCSSNGSCRDAVRIQNSWGKGWEDGLGTSGWVDAKKLLDKSTYADSFLTWFEDKPKGK